jgi:hypothetical protein
MPAFTVSAADFLRRVQYFHFCFLESLLAVVASFVSDPLIYDLTTRLTNSTVSYNVASQPNGIFTPPAVRRFTTRMRLQLFFLVVIIKLHERA